MFDGNYLLKFNYKSWELSLQESRCKKQKLILKTKKKKNKKEITKYMLKILKMLTNKEKKKI